MCAPHLQPSTKNQPKSTHIIVQLRTSSQHTTYDTCMHLWMYAQTTSGVISRFRDARTGRSATVQHPTLDPDLSIIAEGAFCSEGCNPAATSSHSFHDSRPRPSPRIRPSSWEGGRTRSVQEWQEVWEGHASWAWSLARQAKRTCRRLWPGLGGSRRGWRWRAGLGLGNLGIVAGRFFLSCCFSRDVRCLRPQPTNQPINQPTPWVSKNMARRQLRRREGLSSICLSRDRRGRVRHAAQGKGISRSSRPWVAQTL